MARHRCITLYFSRVTRNGSQANPEHDDSLRIYKNSENNIRMIYTDRSEESAPYIDVMNVNYQQMMLYLYRLFWLLAMDSDPFHSVQLFIPGYPTVLMPVAAIQANINQLMDLLGSTCIAWPAIGSQQQSAPIRNPQQPTNSGSGEDAGSNVGSSANVGSV
jgi:hypothetical protein